MKKFFIKDLSGRGGAATHSEQSLRAGWDAEYENANGDVLGDWIESAEAGDVYEHDDDAMTVTCIESGREVGEELTLREEGSAWRWLVKRDGQPSAAGYCATEFEAWNDMTIWRKENPYV